LRAVNVVAEPPGLRGLQNRDELNGPSTLTQIRSCLVFGYVACDRARSDAHALDDIAEVAVKSGIEGLIVSNSTIARPQTLKSRHATEAGGLSGAPLFEPSTKILHETFARTGTKLVLIGVGGVTSGADAYAKIRAGASLVQLYSALPLSRPVSSPTSNANSSTVARRLRACRRCSRLAHTK
jgi:dihydroorotate dehydrogenase